MFHRPFRPASAAVLLLFFALSALPQRVVAQDAPRAALQPGATYAVDIKRVYSGNDGTRNIIPSISEQHLVVATGERERGGMSVQVTVYRPQMSEQPKGYIGDPVKDWIFSFRLTPSGEMADVVSTPAENTTPDGDPRAVLAGHLCEMLFHPAAGLPCPQRSGIRVISQETDSEGRLAIAYTMDSGAETAPAQPVVTTVEGTAVFDAALQYYTTRSTMETTNMYIPSDAGTGTTIVTMQVKTTVLVTMQKP